MTDLLQEMQKIRIHWFPYIQYKMLHEDFHPSIQAFVSVGCTLHTRPETMTEILSLRNSQAKFPAVRATKKGGLSEDCSPSGEGEGTALNKSGSGSPNKRGWRLITCRSEPTCLRATGARAANTNDSGFNEYGGSAGDHVTCCPLTCAGAGSAVRPGRPEERGAVGASAAAVPQRLT